MYKRTLNLRTLTAKASYFLFGPRTTGKSSLIQATLPDALVLDLLVDEIYEELSRRPQALGEKIKKSHSLVVIDEIQKLPKLLDEVHRLIEKKGIRFLLTGSSVKSLRRNKVNMLGGRACSLYFAGDF